MLSYATGHAPANCIFRVAGAEDLPFGDGSFDVIVSSLAFHHIPTEHRGDAVREMFRVAAAGRAAVDRRRAPAGGSDPQTLISGAIGHAMAPDISDQLGELISETGFTITGGGEVLLLGYLTAQRPDHR